MSRPEKLVQRDIDSFFPPVFEAFLGPPNPFVPFFWVILPELKICTGHTKQPGGQGPLDRSLVPCIYNAFQTQRISFALRIKQAYICKNDCRQPSLRKDCQTFLASGLLRTKTAHLGRTYGRLSFPRQKIFNLIGHIHTHGFPRYFDTKFLIFLQSSSRITKAGLYHP